MQNLKSVILLKQLKKISKNGLVYVKEEERIGKKLKQHFEKGNQILDITNISSIVGVSLPPSFSRVMAKASALPKDFIF